MASSATHSPPRSRRVAGAESVDEPYLPRPRLTTRFAILGAVALALFAVLLLRVWALQVLSGTTYLKAAQDNQLRTLRLEAPRGAVVDRNGRVIVGNQARHAVEIWPADLPKTWPEARDELRALGAVLHVPPREMWHRIQARLGDAALPAVVKESIRQDQLVYLSERQDEFPGVRVVSRFERRYPYQSLLAQVLGHVGEIDKAQLEALGPRGYKLGDRIGQSGVEWAYDSYLRGRDGMATVRVDARGRPRSGIAIRRSQRPGNALKLTIDIRLQQAAERALTYGIGLARDAKQWHADGGAIVALDPRDGAVLAMASNPTYMPGVFNGRPDRKKLAPFLDAATAQRLNHPGLNRAIEGTYPPGSTFKPVTALAAMQARLLEPRALQPCTPTFESHGQTFSNWTPNYDRGMTLVEALSTSCDTYFYRIGETIWEQPETRGHPLQEWARKFGFGERTGIDLGPESAGLLPTPEWRRRTFTRKSDPCCWQIDRSWKPGDSIQLAIGQGDLLVTPLQMARLYALIANGGKLVFPHVTEDVEQPASNAEDTKVLRRFGARPPQPTGVDPAAIDLVRQGLWAATHSIEGTSSGVFGAFPVGIAGKTGTAEKVVDLPGYPPGHLESQSWWCGYGPYDNPTIVVCAVIENGGHGGTAAAPAALKVFERWFGRNGQVVSHASD